MWVVVKDVNTYDTYGHALICVFDHKPSFKELKEILPGESDVTIGKLTRGGGRQKWEDEWYYLVELKSGELYKS